MLAVVEIACRSRGSHEHAKSLKAYGTVACTGDCSWSQKEDGITNTGHDKPSFIIQAAWCVGSRSASPTLVCTFAPRRHRPAILPGKANSD